MKCAAQLKLRMCTFFRHFQFPAFGDFDRLLRLVASALGHVLNLLHHIITFQYLSEHDVLSIQPAAGSN